jgi:hypothetical protein
VRWRQSAEQFAFSTLRFSLDELRFFVKRPDFKIQIAEGFMEADLLLLLWWLQISAIDFIFCRLTLVEFRVTSVLF